MGIVTIIILSSIFYLALSGWFVYRSFGDKFRRTQWWEWGFYPGAVALGFLFMGIAHVANWGWLSINYLKKLRRPPGRVLVVSSDYSPSILKSLKADTICTDGKKGYKEIASGRYDVVYMDHYLEPGKTACMLYEGVMDKLKPEKQPKQIHLISPYRDHNLIVANKVMDHFPHYLVDSINDLELGHWRIRRVMLTNTKRNSDD